MPEETECMVPFLLHDILKVHLLFIVYECEASPEVNNNKN